MKIDVRIIDLRDESEDIFSMESWETIRQIKLRVKKKAITFTPHRLRHMKARKGVLEEEQHYYLGDELLSGGMPVDQLRSHAIRKGKLSQSEEGAAQQATTIKMYIGNEPVDFADMLLADVIAKLKSPEEVQKTVRIRVHKSAEETLNFRVNAATITVEELKAELVRALGPPSFTGFSIQNILLYPREKQPGRPLEGEEIREVFGPRPRIDLEAFPVRPRVNLVCRVLKWGMILKERFEITIEDHQLLGDLKKLLLEKLSHSPNPKINQRYSLGNIVFRLDKMRINAATCASLRRKYGVEADELWLRVFNVRDGSQIGVLV